MKRALKLIVAAILLSSPAAFGQAWSNILSSGRAATWTNAGLPSTLTYGTGGSACNGSSANCTETITNVYTPPTRVQCGSTISASGNATTDTSNVNTALAACSPGSYVLLASGAFTFNGTIEQYTQNGVTLRGSGAQSTVVTLTNSAYLEFGAGYSNGICGWTGGYSQGTTSITLSGCNSAPQVGVLLTLSQCNTQMIGCGYNVGSGSTVSLYTAAPGSQFQSAWAGNDDIYVITGSTPTVTAYPITAVTNGTTMTVTGTPTANAYFYVDPPSTTIADNNGLWVCGGLIVCQRSSEGGEATNLQQQIVQVTAVSGSGPYTVTITPGLYATNWSSSQGPSANWATGAHTVTALGNGLEDLTLYNNNDGANYSVQLSNSYGSWVKGVRFVGYAGNYSMVESGTKNCLIFNNYFFPNPFVTGSFPEALQEQNDSDDLILNNIMVSGEAWEGYGQMTGNVFAYNYSVNTFTSYPLNIFEHIPGDMYQLYEGNEAGTLNEDNTHGTHLLNTAFRNYFPGFDSPYSAQSNTSGVTYNPWDRATNSIANVIGASGADLTSYQSVGSAAQGYVWGIGFNNVNSDPIALATSLRWGNWDIVTGAVRWCGNSSNTGWSATCGGSSASVTSCSEATNTVTCLTALNPGTNINFTLSGTSGATYDGTWFTTASSGTSVQFTDYTSGLGSATGGTITVGSEIPTVLASPNAGIENSVPSNTNIPCSFFLSTSTSACTPTYTGGTGFSWYKVCTTWSSFPTSCGGTTLTAYPIAGPELTSGPLGSGYAYHTPAYLAWLNLPIDTTYQNSYTITSSSWTGSVETLTLSVSLNTENLMGAFQLSGVNSACTTGATVGPNNELLMTNSTSTTTISYALASNPGVQCTGTMKFPDVRQFDERVYENDPASNSSPSAPAGFFLAQGAGSILTGVSFSGGSIH